jgi:flavin-dependent dehydrogenase
MFDVIVIGAGISGISFAQKMVPYAKTILIDENEGIPIKTNIFPEHNRPYLDIVSMSDSTIFPRDHIKTLYLGKEESGVINSEEFGDPLGKIVYTDKLLKTHITDFEEKGGIVKFNEKVKRVDRTSEKVEVHTSMGETYSAKVLILATGSRGFEIQKSLGFDTPDSYLGIYTHLYGSEAQIDENFDFDYMFHINPNISKNGPFFFNVGEERVLTGYLGNSGESESEIVDKLDRILSNYSYIQSNVTNLKWDRAEFVTGKISKHPINGFSHDRVLVLGEAAGLVTAFFYEGLLSGLVSADAAVRTLKPLFEQGSNFSSSELNAYDKEVKRILLNKYYNNGDACEYVFYDNSPSTIKKIWETYIDLVNDNQKLRRQIWEAYRMHDVENYDTSRDKWAGEKLFEKLPTFSKISLGPKFLKALMKF